MKKIVLLLKLAILFIFASSIESFGQACAAPGYKVFITNAVQKCSNDSLNLENFVLIKGGMFSINPNPPANVSSLKDTINYTTTGSYNVGSVTKKMLIHQPGSTSQNALFFSNYLAANNGNKNVPISFYNVYQSQKVYYYYNCGGVVKSDAITITVIPVVQGTFAFSKNVPTNGNDIYEPTFSSSIVPGEKWDYSLTQSAYNNIATICSGVSIDLTRYVFPTTNYVLQAGGNINFFSDTTYIALDSFSTSGYLSNNTPGAKDFGIGTTAYGSQIISKINKTNLIQENKIMAVFTDQNGCTFTSFGKLKIAPVPTAFNEPYIYENKNIISFVNMDLGPLNQYSYGGTVSQGNDYYLNIDTLIPKNGNSQIVKICENQKKIYIGNSNNIKYNITSFSFLKPNGPGTFKSILLTNYNSVGSPYVISYNLAKDSAFLIKNEAFINQLNGLTNAHSVVLNSAYDYTIYINKEYINDYYASCPITIKDNTLIDIATPPMAIFLPLRICAVSDTIFNLLNISTGASIFTGLQYTPYSNDGATITFTGTNISDNFLSTNGIKDSTYTYNATVNYNGCVNANYSRLVSVSKIVNISPLGVDTSICSQKALINLTKFVPGYTNLSFSNTLYNLSFINSVKTINSNSVMDLSVFNITDTTKSVTITANGTAGLYKFNKWGCPYSIYGTKTITIKDSPKFTAKDTSVCSSALAYNLTSGVSYNNGNFTYNILGNSISDTVLSGNTLKIGSFNNLNTITDINVNYLFTSNNGCTMNSDRKISILSANQLNLGSDYQICNDQVSLSIKPNFTVSNPISPIYGVDSIKLLYSNPNLFNGTIFNSLGVTTGTYNVTGALTNQYGCTSSDVLHINVGYRPVVNLGGDTTICITSDTILSYNLMNMLTAKVGIFSGANVSNNNLILRGSNPGNYLVNYNYTSPDGCAVAESRNFKLNFVNVNVGGDYTICNTSKTPIDLRANMKVLDDYLNNNFITKVQWNSISNTPNMSGLYFITDNANEGSYKWEASYTSSLGCKSVDTLTINIGSFENISLGNDTSLCQSDTISKIDLNKLSGYSSNIVYSGNGVSNNNFLVKGQPAGNYIVSATYTTPLGCVSYTQKVFKINSIAASITSDSSFITSGNGSFYHSNAINCDSYKWIFKGKYGSDTIIGKSDPFFYFNHSKDTVQAYLSVTSPEGCSLTVTNTTPVIVKLLSSDINTAGISPNNSLNGSPSSNLYASPVPFSDSVTVTTVTENAQNVEFVFVNAIGVKILSQNGFLKQDVTDTSINTSSLPSGIYFLKVITKDSERVLKLIKQ